MSLQIPNGFANSPPKAENDLSESYMMENVDLLQDNLHSL
jgi:hypothetical protein